MVEAFFLWDIVKNLQNIRLHHQTMGTMTLDVLELGLGELILLNNSLSNRTELKTFGKKGLDWEKKGENPQRNETG